MISKLRQQLSLLKTPTRIAIYTAIVAIIAFGGWVIFRKIHTAPVKQTELIRPVKTRLLGEGGNIRQLDFIGRISAKESVELSFTLGGTLIALPVKEGQQVTKGTLIAKINDSDQLSAYESAEVSFKKADADYQRYKNLYPLGAVSLSEFEQFKTAAEVAQANLDITNKKVADAKILAPFDGIVARLTADIGQTVAAGQTLAVLQNSDFISVAIDIPQRYISMYSSGKITAQAFFDQDPTTPYTLTLDEFSTAISPLTQTYEVKFIMQRPKGFLLLSGMTGEVVVQTEKDRTDGNFYLPSNAVFFDAESEGSAVWIVDKETMQVHQQLVTAGALLNDEIEITAGLESGQHVVTAGASLLHEGQLVTLYDEVE